MTGSTNVTKANPNANGFVAIPTTASGPQGPTGQVFNTNTSASSFSGRKRREQRDGSLHLCRPEWHDLSFWALGFGTGMGNGGDLNTLYFTDGINGEADGLFGAISAVPEPSTWAMLLLGFAVLAFAFRQSRRKVSFA
jgi:hypothetical protein